MVFDQLAVRGAEVLRVIAPATTTSPSQQSEGSPQIDEVAVRWLGKLRASFFQRCNRPNQFHFGCELTPIQMERLLVGR